jgi:hypothetical protein
MIEPETMPMPGWAVPRSWTSCRGTERYRSAAVGVPGVAMSMYSGLSSTLTGPVTVAWVSVVRFCLAFRFFLTNSVLPDKSRHNIAQDLINTNNDFHAGTKKPTYVNDFPRQQE